jgi:hypothetical protein
MKRLLALGLLVGLLAPACGRSSTPRADSSQNIVGSVVAGPTCPVESIESPCPPKPIPGVGVEVLSGDRVVVHVTTDAHGRFSVAASPGTYEVRAVRGQQAFMSAKPVTVTVRPGVNATVTIRADTGIR